MLLERKKITSMVAAIVLCGVFGATVTAQEGAVDTATEAVEDAAAAVGDAVDDAAAAVGDAVDDAAAALGGAVDSAAAAVDSAAVDSLANWGNEFAFVTGGGALQPQ